MRLNCFASGCRQHMTAALFLTLALTTASPAADWPKFQGPSPLDVGTGRRELKWAPGESVKWQVSLDGYGQSSPVTWGDRVFVTSVSGPKKERCHVAAFDLSSGKRLWQHDLDSATPTENSNYVSKAAPTPVVDALGLVCFFEGGNLIALTHDGKVRWERNLVAEYGAIESRHGLSASLEQNADQVFVWVERQNEPYVLAVEKKTGGNRWKVAGLGVTSWASPRLLSVKMDEHLVLSGIGRLVGLDPATGKSLWRFEDIQGNSTPTPVPVGDGRFLIGATVGRGETNSGKAAESNGLIAIRAQADGGFRAEWVWKSKRATCSFASPVAAQGHAYFVNATGVLFCLDLETGEERYSNRLGDSNWATPMLLGERLLFFGKGGTVSMVATGPTFTKAGEFVVWETTTSSDPPAERVASGSVLYAAAFARDYLLLRGGDTLYCVATQDK